MLTNIRKTKASGNCLKLFLITALFLFLFGSCATTKIQGTITENVLHNSDSVQYVLHKNTIPNEQLVYHLLTIQLDDPTLEIIANVPSNEEIFIGETTLEFAQKNNVDVAITATPFSYPYTRFSSERKLEGIYIYKGQMYSKPIKEKAALCFTKDKKAYIVDSQCDREVWDAYYAFGGFWTTFEDDIMLQFKNRMEARTAVGLSEDGYTLYLLIVEKNNSSLGLNYMDCSKILKNAGAFKAIQLDGGGSTSLIFNESEEKSVISKRKVANNFGFRWIE